MVQLSGTTSVGPCVVGARLGTEAGSVTSWAAGLTYNRMTAADGEGGVERLNGQQVCCVLLLCPYKHVLC